jgi:hypothetical protein
MFFPTTVSTNPNTKPLDRSSRPYQLFLTLLPYFPDPLPFQPLLDGVRANISRSLADGRLTLLGEVGLDGGARVRWPVGARALFERDHRETLSPDKFPHDSDTKATINADMHTTETDDASWTRLTPFKISMQHQKEILVAQLELAVELGVNVSFHSVAAPGE